MTSASVTAAPSARFSRRSSRGLMLGFTGWRIAALAVAVVIFMAWLMTIGGAAGFALGIAAALLPATGAFFRLGGIPAVEWTPVAVHWQTRRLAGQTTYRARVIRPRPTGTLALPGDAAPLRFHRESGSGVCFIHDPYRNTLSAVLRVTHPAYVLLAPDEQHQRVTAWGRLMAALAQTGTCAGLQVLEASIPDSGEGVQGWFAAHGEHTNGWAADNYESLLAGGSTSASVHRTTLTLTLDLRAAAGAVKASGGGLRGGIRVLSEDMAALEYGLTSAGLRFGPWMDEAELAHAVRLAYDPGLAGEFLPSSPGANLTHAGPLAINEQWGHLQHDSGYSTVLWISEWPRVAAAAHFLHSVVFAPGVRKTFCLHLRPRGVAEALRQIRREKTAMEADRRQKDKIGQIRDLSDDQEWNDVVTREQALISGHADVEYVGWIVVSAESSEALRSAVKQIERAASQAACETRVLYGRQAQGFVAGALPVGRSGL